MDKSKVNFSKPMLIQSVAFKDVFLRMDGKGISTACGAGAGITYMYGGTYQQVSLTIINTLGNIGGIVCDGAKPSCAAKIATSVDAALMAFQLSIQNKSFLPGEGIIKDDIEETIKSMGYIGRVGMRATDTEILNVMIDRADINEEC